MNKKNLFIVLLAMLCLALFTLSASAEQDGYSNWCNIDKDGCWITAEDGGKNYIMFWSEEIRQYYMGDSTKPYTNVTERPWDIKDGKLPLASGRPGRTVYLFDGREFSSLESLAKYISKKTDSTCTVKGTTIICE